MMNQKTIIPKKRGRPSSLKKVDEQRQLLEEKMINSGLNKSMYFNKESRKPKDQSSEPFLTDRL